jgi:hypothetical protein
MSENDSSANGSAPPESGGQPPTPGVAPTAVEYRYPVDAKYPQWLHGKTPDEAAAIASGLYNQALSPQQQQQTVPQQQPQHYQPYQQQAQQQQYAAPDQDAWLTDPGAASMQQMNQMYESKLAPQLEATTSQLASIAVQNAQLQYPNDFNKWGPEIAQQLAQLPPASKTAENIKMVIDIVRGRHANEIQEEVVQRRMQELQDSGTMRPDGSVQGSDTTPNIANRLDLDDERFTHTFNMGGKQLTFRQVCDRYGTTPADIDRMIDIVYVKDKGMTLEEGRKEYIQLLSDGKAFGEVK